MSSRPDRRQFLRAVSAAAVAAPYFWIPSQRADAQGAPRQHRRRRPGPVGHQRVCQAPGLRPGGGGRRGSVPPRSDSRSVSQGARLPGLARAAEERERTARLGERLDARSHARAAGDRGHARTASTSTCRSRWPTRCAKRAPSPSTHAKARVISQMGIQVSSQAPQRYGEWLVRSGVVGKIRAGAHLLEQELGRRQAAARRRRPGAADARLGRVARRRRDAAVQAQRLPPRGMAAAHRVRDRHAGRHGLPHLQSALSRAEADGSDQGDLARSDARRPRAGR